MNLNTLLQVMFANDLDKYVALAVKIDSDITDINLPEEIPVSLTIDDLMPGYTFKDKEGRVRNSGTIKCTVISANPYKLENQFSIELPNGRIKHDVGINKYYDSNTIMPIESTNVVIESPTTTNS